MSNPSNGLAFSGPLEGQERVGQRVSPLEVSKNTAYDSRDRKSHSRANEGRMEDEGLSPLRKEESEDEETFLAKKYESPAVYSSN